MLRTQDGGRTFEDLTPQDMPQPPGGGVFCQIDFASSTVGAVMGIDHYEVDVFRMGHTKSFLAVTQDGARTWRRIEFPSDILFDSFDWVDDRTILVAGQFLWRSDDYGVTWKRVNRLPRGGIRLTVDSSSSSRLWWVAPPDLYRSDDTGATWNEVPFPADFSVENGFFFEGGLAWVSGFLPTRDSALLATVNGGHSWTRLYAVQGRKRLQPFFFTPARGWLLVSKLVQPDDKTVELWSTWDGGRKWQLQSGEIEK